MKYLFLATFAFLLSACVSTETTGFVDPAYRNQNYQVSKVVVRIKGANLDETLKAEQRLADILTDHNVEVIKLTNIAPPTRAITSAQEALLIRKSKADSVLSIYVGDKDSIEYYVPPTYHAGRTTSQINNIGNSTYISTQTSPGYTTGGYSISEPVISTLSSLIDLRQGKEVWRAEGQSSGDEFSSYLDLILSAGEGAIADLDEKGLLPRNKEE